MKKKLHIRKTVTLFRTLCITCPKRISGKVSTHGDVTILAYTPEYLRQYV